MSALGAFILGAAFWPPSGFERRMSVGLVFDEGLSEEDRRAELSRIETTLADADRVSEWSQYADADAKPRSFVWTKVAAFAPAATRAERTIAAFPQEVEGKLSGVEIRFADTDPLRAERFAQAIARTFDAEQTVASDANFTEPVVGSHADAEKHDRDFDAVQREQEELRKSLEAHLEELRSLRSKLSWRAGDVIPPSPSDHPHRGAPLAPPVQALSPGLLVGRSEPAAALAEPVAPGSSVSLSERDERTAPLSVATAKNFLWQAPAAPSRAEIERQLKALDAEIATKKASREELLAKFTIHHPVATALGIAIERLERDRKELAQLLKIAVDDPVPSPPIAPAAPTVPAVTPTPRSSAFPPRSSYASSERVAAERAELDRKEAERKEAERVAAQKVAAEQAAAEKAVAEKAAAEKVAAEQAAAEREQTENAIAERQQLIEAVEAALAREAKFEAELAAFAEASQELARDVRTNSHSSASATSAIVLPAKVRAEIVDRGAGEGIFERLGALLLGSVVFALAMTGLTWFVGRERPVASAEEVHLASGLPVIGQTSAGLLDRKPRRNVAAFAVGGAQKLVYGAAFATAVFCVAALAAENPRCLRILRQPLAVAWQALESLT